MPDRFFDNLPSCSLSRLRPLSGGQDLQGMRPAPPSLLCTFRCKRLPPHSDGETFIDFALHVQDSNPRIKSGEIPPYTGIVNCFTRVSAEQGACKSKCSNPLDDCAWHCRRLHGDILDS